MEDSLDNPLGILRGLGYGILVTLIVAIWVVGAVTTFLWILP